MGLGIPDVHIFNCRKIVKWQENYQPITEVKSLSKEMCYLSKQEQSILTWAQKGIGERRRNHAGIEDPAEFLFKDASRMLKAA